MPLQPQVRITQQFESDSVVETEFLPTLVIGPRYDLVQYPEDRDVSFIVNYDGNDNDNNDYDYPEKQPQSIVDQDSVVLYGEQVDLKYYDSTDEGSVWRKIGSQPNRLRTVLSSGLVFKDDPDELFPHSPIFNDRGVKVGDTVIVNSGTESLTTQVIDFVADKSIASIDSAVANAGNQTALVGTIGPAVPGPNSTASIVTSVAGTYAGSLLRDVLNDNYSIKVIQSGTTPNISIDATQSTSTLVVETDDFYDFAGAEIYTIEVITGGALATATYRVTSLSGIDNQPTQVTPALSTFVDLNSRGTQFRFTGAGTLTAGDKWVISVIPSTARLQILSESGTDNTLNRVFPGYGKAFSISGNVLGVSITVAQNTSANLTLNDRWTITVAKDIDVVVATSAGEFTGPVDINYIVEVVQGGEFGQCAVSVQSTAGDSQNLITIDGSGSGNAVSIGDFGAEIFFDANIQNGLVLGDIFSIIATAAKDTALRTIVTKDSLPSEADTTNTGLAVYTGSNGTPNTGTSGGTYNSGINAALQLNLTELYTISVVTDGAYGVAEISWISSSGLDDAVAPVVIPVTPGTAIPIGTAGVTIAFTDANTFELTDSWTIQVDKPNLDVKVLIRKDEVLIPNKRQDNPALDAWIANEDDITINSGICLIEPEWDLVDCLPIESGLIYAEYRALHVQGANSITSVEQRSAIEAAVGKVDVDNPIGISADAALVGSTGGTNPGAIFLAYVESDDLDGYIELLDKLELRNKGQVYRIVPATGNRAVIDAVEAHINKMSTPDKNKWRYLICSVDAPAVFDVIGTAEDSDFTATIAEDPSSPGSFTIMKTTDANFTTVQVGDKAVYLGKEYDIVSVKTATELEISPGLTAAQTVPATLYIYHVPTKEELADLYKFYGESFANRKVINVVPDEFEKNGEILPGYVLASFLAGLKSAVLPHQPLTNFDVSYADSVPLTLETFNDTDLENISDGGNLIIQQDSINDVPYVRQQLTTDLSDIKNQEWSVNENLDDIAYGVLDIMSPFIGKFNLHTGVLPQIRTNLDGFLFAKTEVINNQAGPQIEDFEILRLESDPLRPDRLIVEIRVFLPVPFNYADILIIGATATIG